MKNLLHIYKQLFKLYYLFFRVKKDTDGSITIKPPDGYFSLEPEHKTSKRGIITLTIKVIPKPSTSCSVKPVIKIK